MNEPEFLRAWHEDFHYAKKVPPTLGESMISKTFEIRDRGTLIAVLAIQFEAGNSQDSYLLARSGFGKQKEDQRKYILLYKLYDDGVATYDAYAWPDNTTKQAHLYINDHFDELETGQVIDCEYLRGESESPKISEYHDGLY
jgi:hypothetical protein